MKYVSETNITRKDFKRINRLLSEVNFDYEDVPEIKKIIDYLDARKDTTPYSFSFRFTDGSRIYIDIRCGNHNYYDDCLWVSADRKSDYLFDCGFSLEEEMDFHPNDDDVYVCKFIIEGD